MAPSPRTPNVLVLGTPGCGKSTLCRRVMQRLSELSDADPAKAPKVTHLNIADLIRDKKLYVEWDSEMDCSVYDDALLEAELSGWDFKAGGLLVEFHGCELFAADQFDRVFVLTTEIGKLRERLEARAYSEAKVRRNVDCEIFQTCLYDAYEVFDRDRVRQLESNTEADLERNAALVADYLANAK